MARAQREWREIPGYPRYRISNDGAIEDLNRGKPLPIRTAQDGGYPKVCLQDHLNGVVHHYVHNLVARTFIGPPGGERPLVMHLDHNPQNNHVSNLRWGTHKTNAAGRMERGTVIRGAAIHNAVLTDAKVVEIRKAFASGMTTAPIAKQFGVSIQTVNNIVRGRSWRHVGGPAAPTSRLRKAGMKLTEDDVREIRRRGATGDT